MPETCLGPCKRMVRTVVSVGQLIGQAELEQIRFSGQESVDGHLQFQQGCLGAVSRSAGRSKWAE